MKIGFLSAFDAERIRFAKAHGFGSVELLTGYFASAPAYMPGKDGWKGKAKAVKAAYDKAGIRVSALGAFYMNHLDPKIAEACKETVRSAVVLAEAIGVGVVAGFAGRVMGEPLEKSLPPFKALWTEHARFAADHGVKIAFETCPMGYYHTPENGINVICTPEMYERCLDAVPENVGLEWDPSHLVPQFVDPVENLRKFGKRVYHVHAKGAKVYANQVGRYGLWNHRSVEHCFPGLGDEDWGQIIKELRRAGYHGDLNIEGWHDHVFRNKSGRELADVVVDKAAPAPPNLEDAGLLLAKAHLERFCPAGF